jgi:hypothetical protein
MKKEHKSPQSSATPPESDLFYSFSASTYSTLMTQQYTGEQTSTQGATEQPRSPGGNPHYFNSIQMEDPFAPPIPLSSNGLHSLKIPFPQSEIFSPRQPSTLPESLHFSQLREQTSSEPPSLGVNFQDSQIGSTPSGPFQDSQTGSAPCGLNKLLSKCSERPVRFESHLNFFLTYTMSM